MNCLVVDGKQLTLEILEVYIGKNAFRMAGKCSL